MVEVPQIAAMENSDGQTLLASLVNQQVQRASIPLVTSVPNVKEEEMERENVRRCDKSSRLTRFQAITAMTKSWPCVGTTLLGGHVLVRVFLSFHTPITSQQNRQGGSKVLDQFVFDLLQLSSDTALLNMLTTLESHQSSDV